MKDKDASKLSYLYTLISIVFGPTLLYLSSTLFPKQIACFDLESSLEYYLLQDGGPKIPHQEVVQYYYASATFLAVGAGIMTVLGLLLLRRVFSKKHAISRKHKIISSLLIISMLVGYGLILAFAALNIWCTSV